MYPAPPYGQNFKTRKHRLKRITTFTFPLSVIWLWLFPHGYKKLLQLQARGSTAVKSQGYFNILKIKRNVSSLGLTSTPPSFWAAWWSDALILSAVLSNHSLSHYLHCMLLHQKNICEHYLTNWSLNEPLAEGAFGLPLGSQSGCRRKMLTDAEQRLEREKELSCQCSWEEVGASVGKQAERWQ